MSYLNSFFQIYSTFFTSDLFTDLLVYAAAFGLIPAIIYLIWHILRGY